MRLHYAPDQPRVRQTLALHANVTELSCEPLSKGDVRARITAPWGKNEIVRISPASEEWGVFHARFTTAEPGKHEITLTCTQTGARLDTSVFVQGTVTERPGRAARPEVMEEIARVTRGKMLDPSKMDEL